MNLKDHEDWIRANASCMTIHDMMEELEWPHIKSFRNFCTRNGIVPLTNTGKKKAYILSLYTKKPMKFFAEKLELCIERVEQLYKELGIEEPDFFDNTPALSVIGIFQRCHVGGQYVK